MAYQNLSDSFVKDILNYLECPTDAPTLRYLNRIIYAYIRKVPWESVSRIVKRHTTTATSDCPRWPAEFWRDAMRYGFGGTCFESSLAFYDLLTSLGYQGYLTVNDMDASRACHAAIVIIIHGQKYLVDITIPVHCAVRFDPQSVTKRRTSFQNYTIRPLGQNKYVVERSHHPRSYAFTLIDVPLSLPDYRSILEKDYETEGFFLKSVVMTKVIDGKAWRFFSEHKPYKLESFDRQGKTEILLPPEILTQTLADKFGMPEDKIMTAFLEIHNPIEPYQPVRMSRSINLQLSTQ